MYSHTLADTDVVIDIFQFLRSKTYILSINCLFMGQYQVN